MELQIETFSQQEPSIGFAWNPNVVKPLFSTVSPSCWMKSDKITLNYFCGYQSQPGGEVY